VYPFLTVLEIAGHCGVSIATIRRWRRGGLMPSALTADALERWKAGPGANLIASRKRGAPGGNLSQTARCVQLGVNTRHERRLRRDGVLPSVLQATDVEVTRRRLIDSIKAEDRSSERVSIRWTARALGYREVDVRHWQKLGLLAKRITRGAVELLRGRDLPAAPPPDPTVDPRITEPEFVLSGKPQVAPLAKPPSPPAGTEPCRSCGNWPTTQVGLVRLCQSCRNFYIAQGRLPAQHEIIWPEQRGDEP
jgi:hypothetical protein